MIEQAISGKLTFHARHSIKEAEEIAVFCHDTSVLPKHLLFAIFKERGSLGGVLLRTIGLTDASFETVCHFPLSQTQKMKKVSFPKEKKSSLVLSESTKKSITRAYAVASEFMYPYVGSEHLAYALLESDDTDIQVLMSAAVLKTKDFRSAFAFSDESAGMQHLAKVFNLPPIGIGFRRLPSDDTQSETPFLDQYGTDITEEVREHPEIFTGRKNELLRTLHILGRRIKNNPVLIGEPGVGKTTLVRALANEMIQGNAGDRFANTRIVSIDVALLVAGTNFRGEFEARLKDLIYEASEHPEIILFIDEIHTLIGAGNTSGGLDASNILKPALSRGEIRCIGATTFAEYKKHIEKDQAFERRFQPVFMNEPTPEEAVVILSEGRSSYETFHDATITKDAVLAAVEWSVRFLPDRFLPDKAFDLIDEAASSLRHNTPQHPLSATIRKLEAERKMCQKRKEDCIRKNDFEQGLQEHTKEQTLLETIAQHRTRLKKSVKKVIVTKEAVASVISAITHIPIHKILSQQNEKIVHLSQELSRRIIGQEEALDRVSSTLLRAFAGVSHPDRPLGSFLFLGPSGTGKTLTAKVLSEILFESKDALIRLDMSEFSERHSTAQIIGAPAGYIGYGEGGKLTEKIRRKPHSVVLFDEIEKAHPDVFNILLQVLDEGFLTDAEGRKISFRNTVIILTSNIGTRAFTDANRIGFRHSVSANAHSQFEGVRSDVLKDLRKQLRPELLNRLDHIAVFRPLDTTALHRIVDMELCELITRLKQRNITVRYTKSVVDSLAHQNTGKEQGARAIRKIIQESVEQVIAEQLVKHPDTCIVSLTVTKGVVTARV